ncbi:MAG: N-succinylarginine dihydrolase [Planctomycetota bacterium]
MTAREFNFDSIVGPTHNYAALAYGNIASAKSGGSTSKPRDAAKQGLAKMRQVLALGVPQAILPPHHRPDLDLLRTLGFTGNAEQLLTTAAEADPALVHVACSASAMWAANAATVSPSIHTADARVHLTPANLASNTHRAIEPPQTVRTVRAIFANDALFAVHDPLPGLPALSDEGAANHTTLCPAHGEPGVELYVYGAAIDPAAPRPERYPARQTERAARAVARHHTVDPDRLVFAHQSPHAIDHGVFHNDVIAVGTERTLLYHEHAFADEAAVLDALRRATDDALEPIRITDAELPIDDAVRTYLFNSQLLRTPDDGLTLLAPCEVRDHPGASAVADSLVGRAGIAAVVYAEVRESMRNGGGPACLRLRVALTENEAASVAPGVIATPDRLDELERWVDRHYRETLTPDELADPALERESQDALDELTTLLGLPAIYPFQLATTETH